MMNQNFTYNSIESAGLRDRLENQLTGVFTSDKISKHLTINGCASELQIIHHYENETPALPQIKQAYHIWLAMDVAHRHAVLGKFQCLYAGLNIAGHDNSKTLVFCSVFIHEFAAILGEAMEWPH